MLYAVNLLLAPYSVWSPYYKPIDEKKNNEFMDKKGVLANLSG
jgi:hypothetical protein